MNKKKLLLVSILLLTLVGFMFVNGMFDDDTNVVCDSVSLNAQYVGEQVCYEYQDIDRNTIQINEVMIGGNHE